MSKTQLKSNSRLELYSIIKELEKQKKELEKKLAHTKVLVGEQRDEKNKFKRRLDSRKPLQAGRPRSEELSETRKIQIGQIMAKTILSEVIASDHNIVVNDISKLILKISDFSTREKIPMRGLGILLFTSNFKRIRRKMFYDSGVISSSWYAPVTHSLIKSGYLVLSQRLTRVREYEITEKGMELVNRLVKEIEEYINVKET